MQYIKMKAIDVYHPKNQLNKAQYIEEFQEKGRDISNFLNIMGRENYYRINNADENSVTMAIEASKKVLKKAELTGDEIDMVIFSSQVPEYTFPSNAIFVHQAIQGKKDCIVYDNNANCAGMTIAVEQASRYMMSSPHVVRALIVGSDYLSLVANPEQEITTANFGDAACAVILEKTDEETGFIDAIYETDSSFKDNILYPANGFSQYMNKGEFLGYVDWKPFDGTVSLPYTFEKIQRLLERNHYSMKDVAMCCFSQFALVNIQRIQEHFAIADEKIVYVGDEYGYTGTNSPFITMYEGIESGKIKRGDLVLFWTIGGGHEFICMLFRY